MFRDTFDKLLWSALAGVIVILLVFPFVGNGRQETAAALQQDKGREQEQLLMARRLYRQQIYEPVESLRKSGQYSQALLKLEEMARTNPGDAHAFILKGEILAAMGAPGEAAANFAQGVRLDGGYLEKTNPLSRREAISKLVSSQLLAATARANSTPASRTDDETVRNLRYLQSRLAGGCE